MIFGWFLIDEVWDGGNELILCKSKHRERIQLANIISLTHQSVMFPTWSTLTLRTPCRFGSKIRFLTMMQWGGKADPAFYDSLIKRIANAHRG